MEHKFDTTGRVNNLGNGRKIPRKVSLAWDDLSPFTKGYVEALFAAHSIERTTGDGRVFSHGAFDMLAPETLARIIADCERFCAGAGYYTAEDAARFWGRRQSGGEAQYGFPLLKVKLGDDGKVRFAA